MNLANKLKYGFVLLISTSVIFTLVFIYSTFSSAIFENMNFLAWIYYILAAFGHASIISSLLYIIFYIPFALAFKKQITAIASYTTAAILVQFILIIDSYVFDLYRFHINGFVLELILGDSASDIFVFDWTLYLKLIGIVIAFVILPFIGCIFISIKYYTNIKACKITILCLLCSFSIVVSHLGYAVARATGHIGIQKSATMLPLFFPLSANSLLTKLGIITPNSIDNLSYNQTSTDLQYPLHPIEVDNKTVPQYNIIYITIDSWNPSTFDSIVTPNIYKFAHKGQIFNKHLSSNNGTRGSLFGMFFGLSFTYETEFSISKMSPLFIDRLLDLNYDIHVFPSACFTNPPFHEIIFRRVPGIATKTKGETPFDRDNNITHSFVDFIKNKNDQKPFFSFIFYDLPHAISIPERYRKQFQPSWDCPKYLELSNSIDRKPFFNLYKNCVYYTDELIGEVLNNLEREGMLENTIVVITGDHGQEFNENKKNYWGHGGNYSKWQIQIPLIIYYPGIEGGKIYEHTTTHYDLSPTMLNRFLGVKNPSEDYSMGHDLWDTTKRFPHIVGDHVKYAFILDNVILKTGHTGTIDVTDLHLNSISRDSIDTKELQEAIKIKNKFYK